MADNAHIEAHKFMETRLGRSLTDKEARLLDSTLDAIGSNTGSIGRAIALFEFYYMTLNKIPEKCQKAVNEIEQETLEKAKHYFNCANNGIEQTGKQTRAKLEAEADQFLQASSSMQQSVKNLIKWIIGGVITCGLVTILLCFGAYQIGKKNGIAEQRNEEFALQETNTLANSVIGKEITDLIKSGFLSKDRLAFLQSKDGQRVYEYYSINRLQDVTRFFDSPLGELVDDYMMKTKNLELILLCKEKGWEIQQNSAGLKMCFPKGGFEMPKSAQ